MKLRILTLLAAVSVATLSRAQDFIPEGYALKEGAVLVELFTSEGCSSCPPAEKALQKLADEAAEKKVPIYLISWHVDYWDKLRTHHGVWKDPYSSAKHTKRQRGYAIHFAKKGITKRPMLITPQFLFNGLHRQTFESKGLMNQLQEAAPKLTPQSVTGSVTPGVKDVSVSWKLAETVSLDEVVLTVVLTESNVRSKVTAGENFGESFVHNHLARASETLKPEEKEGEVTLTFPSNWQGENPEVTILIQDNNFQVIDFIRLPIPAKAEPLAMNELDQILDNTGVCTQDGCTKPGMATVVADGQTTSPAH